MQAGPRLALPEERKKRDAAAALFGIDPTKKVRENQWFPKSTLYTVVREDFI